MTVVPTSYICRLCWNTNGWIKPAGQCATLETGTYVSEYGFGHEEWLFDVSKMVGGFHYGHAQPISRSRNRLVGQQLGILLYTIAPDRNRYYIGQIKRCEVLNRDSSDAVRQAYKANGWLRSMEDDLRRKGIRDAALPRFRVECRTEQLFTIRFRPEDMELYELMRIAQPSDRICRPPNRYQLISADERTHTEWMRRRKGRTALKNTDPFVRHGKSEVLVDQHHDRLQNRLFALLVTKYGKSAALMEEDFVDIAVQVGKQRHLIEVKSSYDAREAVREAIGQLLEYAYYRHAAKDESANLVVAAPGAKTAAVEAYLQKLNGVHGLRIHYIQVSDTMDTAPNFEEL